MWYVSTVRTWQTRNEANSWMDPVGRCSGNGSRRRGLCGQLGERDEPLQGMVMASKGQSKGTFIGECE